MTRGTKKRVQKVCVSQGEESKAGTVVIANGCYHSINVTPLARLWLVAIAIITMLAVCVCVV